jgi:hypothetical protein
VVPSKHALLGTTSCYGPGQSRRVGRAKRLSLKPRWLVSEPRWLELALYGSIALRTSKMKVYIHTGFLSLDNGAVAPLTQYFDLAKLLGVSATTGVHYGEDSLEVPDEQWPLVEEILTDSRLVYQVHGVHNDWQNAQRCDPL